MPLEQTGVPILPSPPPIGLDLDDQPRIRTKRVPGDPSICTVSRVLPGYKALHPEHLGWVALRNERYRPMAVGPNRVRMNPTHEYRSLSHAIAHLIKGEPRPDAISLEEPPSGHRNHASTQKPPAGLVLNAWERVA